MILIVVVVVVSFWKKKKNREGVGKNIWRKKINGDTDRPTDRPTDQPSNKQGEYSAICLFEGWKIEGRDLQNCKIGREGHP